MVGGAGPIVEIRDLDRTEYPAAIGVLARGMRDNPLHVAAFGDDPERRRQSLERIFRTLLRVKRSQSPVGAFDGAALVGLTGVEPAGMCQATVGQRLRFLPAMLALGPHRDPVGLVDGRVGRERSRRASLAPRAARRRRASPGAGHSAPASLGEHCRRLDADREVGYLETDKPENVRLYERHGFVVIGEALVIDVPNWFMRREATAVAN